MTEEIKKESLNTFVSIVMAVRNEEDAIEATLKSVLNQNYPKNAYEIIVADGMSDDQTCEIIKHFQKEHSNLQLIENPKKIVASGLNRAIEHAKGEIIVRVDGHTQIATNYLEQCVQLLNKYESVDNVGGRMIPKSETLFGKAVALATSTPFGVGNSHFHYVDEERYVDTVYMGAWRKNIFKEVGGFDEQFVRNQDDEFNYRLLDHDKQILLSPRLESVYIPRGNLISLWNQYYQYGFWKVGVMQKHPEQMRLRQVIPSLFVMSLVLFGLLSFLSFFAQIFSTIIGAYLLANVVSSVYFTLGKDKPFNPFIPIVYMVIHISYGVGFILGCLRGPKLKPESRQS